ncbi:hypothetical protein [Rhizobacter sp. OV335]|uniref:hypothetical protein n=1 Tax=Rhizobacter sp. OV335 TaxID=1500264 RepID=UPI0013566572|nr:hypothetical protein [Rhizobacter sp. OV335]
MYVPLACAGGVATAVHRTTSAAINTNINKRHPARGMTRTAALCAAALDIDNMESPQ